MSLKTVTWRHVIGSAWFVTTHHMTRHICLHHITFPQHMNPVKTIMWTVPSVTWPIPAAGETHEEEKHKISVQNEPTLSSETSDLVPLSVQDMEARDWTAHLSITALTSGTEGTQVQPHKQMNQIDSWFSFLWWFSRLVSLWTPEVYNSLSSKASDWLRWLKGRGSAWESEFRVEINSIETDVAFKWIRNKKTFKNLKSNSEIFIPMSPERSLTETCKYKTSIKFKIKTKLLSFCASCQWTRFMFSV